MPKNSGSNNTSSKKIKTKKNKGLFDNPLFKAVKKFSLGEHVEQKPSTDKSPVKSVKDNENHHEVPGVSQLYDHDAFKYFKEKKDKIIQITAAFIGFLLIIVGIILISNSTSRVVDNVVFGEQAMFAVFLILIGVLILAAVFARKYLNDTFFKKIHTELEVEEEKSKKSRDDASTEKDRMIDKKA
ncbi:MAG TPA: hypothetical protein VF324_06505 [Methanobacterium sp.]